MRVETKLCCEEIKAKKGAGIEQTKRKVRLDKGGCFRQNQTNRPGKDTNLWDAYSDKYKDLNNAYFRDRSRQEVDVKGTDLNED